MHQYLFSGALAVLSETAYQRTWSQAMQDRYPVGTQTILSSPRQELTGIDLQRGEAMTDEQLKHVVEHLCEHLHLAIRLKGSEAHPPNAKEIGFDSASVRTVLLTGLRAAGVTIHHEISGANEEPPWS